MDPYLSEDHKLARLREAVMEGDAEDLIAERVDGPGAYKAALQELDSWYGGTMREVDRYEKELMAAPRITNEHDVDALKNFAIKLRNTLINLDTCGIVPGRELYLELTQKVQKSMLACYLDSHNDSQCDVRAFSEFLLKWVHCHRQVEERMSGAELSERQRPVERPGKRDEQTSFASHQPAPMASCIYRFWSTLFGILCQVQAAVAERTLAVHKATAS